MKKYELTTVQGKDIVIDISQLFREEVLYVNATSLARQFGKSRNMMYQFFNSNSFKEYLDAYSNVTENSDVKLIEKREGRYGGTYIHSDILLPVLRYLSPEFAVKCDLFIRKMIQQVHDEIIAAKATATANKKYELWNEQREQGKIAHRSYTDTIKAFCLSAEEQRGGSYAIDKDGNPNNKPCPYYIHFQRLVYQRAGVELSKGHLPKRDTLSGAELEEVESVESDIAELIEHLMIDRMDYKKIFKQIKNRLYNEMGNQL